MAKILLVDDDRDLASLTRTTLIKHGHEVFVFHEASRAIEHARQQNPDLILMDIMLPQMSGAQAVKKMQEVPGLQNVPVIFLTGLVSSAEEDLEKTGINIDNRTYKTLGKPFEIEELLKVIDSYVGD